MSQEQTQDDTVEAEVEIKSIIKLDPKEFGLEEQKALEIQNAFIPIAIKMEAMEKEYLSLVILSENTLIQNEDGTFESVENVENIEAMATELLKRYVKVRTGTSAIHKDEKDLFWRGGKYCDAWKNEQIKVSTPIEKKLAEIKDYRKNIEEAKIQKLSDERTIILEELDVQMIPSGLGKINKKEWDDYVFGIKETIRLKKDEEDRLLAEELRKEEEAKDLKIANKKLEDEAEANRIEADRKQKAIDTQNEVIRKTRERNEKAKQKIIDDAKAEADKKKEEADEKLRLEKEKADKEIADAKAETQRLKDKAIQDEKDRLQKIEDDRIAKEKEDEEENQKRLNASDADKKLALIKSLDDLAGAYTFTSDANIKMFDDVKCLLQKVIKHIQGE